MKNSLKHWRMRCSLRWFERRQKSFSALNGRSIGRNRWFRIDWFNSFNWWLFFLSLCAIRAPVFKNKSNYSINHLKSLTSFITIDYKSFISWKDFLLYFQQCILHNFQAYFYLVIRRIIVQPMKKYHTKIEQRALQSLIDSSG